jgi:lysophospholipase L1-like esterase
MNKLKSVFYVLFLTVCITVQTVAQDWSGLGRYREDNIKIGMPLPKEKRVVFMGNSITDSWSEVYPDFFYEKPYINRGISGQTTQQMLIRFRADVINLKPYIVVILAGTNDIAGNAGPSTLEMIEDNIISMVQLAKANKIKVVLCSVLPVLDYPWKPGLEPANKVIALNKLLKEVAHKENVIYVDIYTEMVNEQKGMKEEYSEDGVHPNIVGYKVMGPLVEKAIATLSAK